MKKKDSYHHGDLRRKLIEAAVASLAEEGVANLSLRKLAVRLGVSHNAPYMHFPNRDALLAAIAQHGFRELRAELLADGLVIESDESWEGRLIEGCRTYVRYGTEHPNLFQVMFMEHDYKAYPEMLEESLAALKTLTDILSDGQSRGLVREGDANDYAALVWSLLHGVAVLSANRTENPLPFGTRDTEVTIRWFVENILRGLAP